MPMKLNVGVSRKKGLADYGSVGASCNLELELDATLLERDLDAFHSQVRSAYVAAHQAVHDELARLQVPTDPGAGRPSQEHASTSARNDHGRENGNADSARPQGDRGRLRKPATANQVKAILAIARRQNVDLDALLRQEFQVGRLEDLSLRQASEVIDLLKTGSQA